MTGPVVSSLSDPARLSALRDAIRVRPFPSPAFDAVTRVVTRGLRVPVALVSLIDDRQQHVFGATGLGPEFTGGRSTPVSTSLCQYVVTSQAVLRIDDTRTHPVFREHPVGDGMGGVAYLGVPLTLTAGHTLGTLCAIDTTARCWTDDEVAMLTELSQAVTAELELRALLTEREDALRERDDSLDIEGLPSRAIDVLESSNECIVAVDRRGMVTYVGDFAAQSLQIARETVLGAPLAEVLPFFAEAEIATALEDAVRTRRRTVLSTYLQRLQRWMDVRIVPVRYGLSIYLNDVTERREAETALAVREAQLQQVQKMEAIGNLAGGVAHDFNNLLTVIRTNSELLLERTPTEVVTAPLLQEIQTAALQATLLTRQLLTFGQKQVVRPEVVAVAPALSALLPVLKRLMPDGVTIAVAGDLHNTAVVVDPRQLEQLVMNLVLNAREAMPDGGLIRMVAKRERLLDALRVASGVVAPGAYICLTVSDTGRGMSAEILPRIFEPFFTTKRGDGSGAGLGAGLGLSTVFGIVQQAHGGVHVESVPGTGTTFFVYLPEAQTPQALQQTLAMTTPPPMPRILVVDDEAGVRTVVQRVLEARGYRVVLAVNGAEGLRRLEETPDGIDLLLTDIMMPVMNGFELTDVMRARRPGLPVLLMSGYADVDSVQRQLHAPRVSFLPKPFTAASLCDAIRGLLEPPPMA